MRFITARIIAYLIGLLCQSTFLAADSVSRTSSLYLSSRLTIV